MSHTDTLPGRPVAELLVACGRGDESAFAQLYDATSSRVHGLTLRVLRDPAQAEEVTQEVYLVVWQTAARFDPSRGTPLAWLLTIAHRKAVDRVRSSEASRRREASEHALGERTRGTVEVPGEGCGQEVRTALRSLSGAHREAIELAYFGGFTHHEVSVLLQIPLGTAKSRIRDGLLRLRQLMAPVDPQPA